MSPLVAHLIAVTIAILAATIIAFAWSLIGRRPSRDNRRCQNCAYVGYPVASIFYTHGQCRRFAPRPGTRGPERWPIVDLASEVCGDHAPGPLVVIQPPADDSERCDGSGTSSLTHGSGSS